MILKIILHFFFNFHQFHFLFTEIDCGNPQEQLPSGGQLLTGASSVYLNNQSFTFDCVPGYIKEGASELTGDYQVQCKENGRWSFGTLRCSGWLTNRICVKT